MPPLSPELAKRLAAVKAEQDEQKNKVDALDKQNKQNKQKANSNGEVPASRDDETGSQVIASGDVTPSEEGVWRKDRKDVHHQPPAGYKEGKKQADLAQ